MRARPRLRPGFGRVVRYSADESATSLSLEVRRSRQQASSEVAPADRQWIPGGGGRAGPALSLLFSESGCRSDAFGAFVEVTPPGVGKDSTDRLQAEIGVAMSPFSARSGRELDPANGSRPDRVVTASADWGPGDLGSSWRTPRRYGDRSRRVVGARRIAAGLIGSTVPVERPRQRARRPRRLPPNLRTPGGTSPRSSTVRRPAPCRRRG